MHQPKVENVQEYEDSQGSHIVTPAKLILISDNDYETISSSDRMTIRRKRENLPILISETEEIEEGDWFYHEHTNTIAKASNTSLNNIFTSLEGGKSNYIRAGCVKILALPEHFSDEHLQAIADGKMEDRDKVLVKCFKSGRMEMVGVHTTNEYSIHLDQQTHITLFPATQSLEEAIENYVNSKPASRARALSNDQIKDIEREAMRYMAEWAKKNNY